MSKRLPIVTLLALMIPVTPGFLGSLNAADWPMYRHDLTNSGRSTETGISSSNIAQFSVKSGFPIALGGGASVTPAVATVTINGVATSTIYVGNWTGGFYGLNALNGQSVWPSGSHFQIPSSDLPSAPQQVTCSTNVGPYNPTTGFPPCRIASSAAVSTVSGGSTYVFFGAANAAVYALNAATGAEEWKWQLPDRGCTLSGTTIANSSCVLGDAQEIWSSPVVYNGLVYFGVASHGDNPCVAGEVVAVNATTGAQVWSQSMVDWGGTGAAVWSSPAIDITNNIVYVGTGNPCTGFSQGNPALWSDSIVALNASTGTMMGYYQAIPGDTGDQDFGSSPIIYSTLYTNSCTGANTTNYYVAEGSKNGKLYVHTRNSSGIPMTSGYSISLEAPAGLIASPSVINVPTRTVCGQAPNKGTVLQDDANIFAPSTSGWLFDVDASSVNTGALSVAWQTSVDPSASGLYSAAASIEDLVIFGSGLNGTDNSLHVAATSSGALLKDFTATGMAHVFGGPSISNGRIYFIDGNGKLYCLSYLGT